MEIYLDAAALCVAILRQVASGKRKAAGNSHRRATPLTPYRSPTAYRFRFIDWLMRLPEELEDRFWQELEQYEEEKTMPYVTSVERIGMKKGMQQGLQQGMQKGMQEGRQEGQATLLPRQLEQKFVPK